MFLVEFGVVDDIANMDQEHLAAYTATYVNIIALCVITQRPMTQAPEQTGAAGFCAKIFLPCKELSQSRQ
jgi:hypothetical protein